MTLSLIVFVSSLGAFAASAPSAIVPHADREDADIRTTYHSENSYNGIGVGLGVEYHAYHARDFTIPQSRDTA